MRLILRLLGNSAAEADRAVDTIGLIEPRDVWNVALGIFALIVLAADLLGLAIIAGGGQ